MSSHLAFALLIGLASLLAGLVIGRGLLKRRQADTYRALAKDLTDKVHDRCDAYRRLEGRIAGVIGDFDRDEAHPADELTGQAPRRQDSPAGGASAQTVVSACGDGLAWMDACAGSCQPVPVQVEETRFAEHPTTSATSARTVEGEIDAFAQRLRGAQDSNRALLDEQSRAIGDLQRRIASIESSAGPAPLPYVAANAPGAGRRAASQDPELRELSERLAGSGRELREWRARCEEVVQEREADIAKARDLLAQMRSDAPACHPEGTLGCETCARAQELARQIIDLRPVLTERGGQRSQPRSAQPASAGTEGALSSHGELQSLLSAVAGAAKVREVTEHEHRLASKQLELDAMRGELSRATQVIDGNRTRITHLMRSLEETQAKAEERRRLVQEQSSHVTEAYSMLDRMRPLLKAIEGAAADNQFSALTPEYLEARGRG